MTPGSEESVFVLRFLAIKMGAKGKPSDVKVAFDEGKVVVVKFTADWCGPCKRIQPDLEKVGAETGAVLVCIDVDDHSDYAQEHGVTSIPAMVVKKRGFAGQMIVGDVSKVRAECERASNARVGDCVVGDIPLIEG